MIVEIAAPIIPIFGIKIIFINILVKALKPTINGKNLVFSIK